MVENAIIRNGTIIDGSGNPWFKGDLCIENEKISHIGNLDGIKADEEIDASGLIVCPGFIDVHSHGDVNSLINPKADSKITQGITTQIVGNCGLSAAPISKDKNYFLDYFRDADVNWEWNTIAEYLQVIQSTGIPLNIGTHVGYQTIRVAVMGYESRDPTIEEHELMKALLEGGMKDGAFGLSIMFKSAPGSFAKVDEIIDLCKIVKKYRGMYVPHQRTQGDTIIEDIDISINIGKKSGVPVHISHLKVKGRRNWGKAKTVLRIIDEARKTGLDITFDQYPYSASGGSVGMPSWAMEGGFQKLLIRLKDAEQRKKIEEDMTKLEDAGIGADNIKIAVYAPDRSYEGKSLAELSEKLDKSPESTWCHLLLQAGETVSVNKYSMCEEDLIDIMTHHAMMVGSDGRSLSPYGVLGRGKMHPRNYGSFPRYLGRYVIRNNVTSIEDGIRRMTSFPAQKFGLRDRGLLHTSNYADIVIFDPNTVIDAATFENPYKYSQGIEYVWVNGTMEIEKGKYNGELAGKSLKNKLY